MTGFIEIVTWPTHLTGRGQRYRVEHGGDVLIESTGEPFYSAARALMALGVDPDDTLISINGQSSMPTLCARIGWAAAHTVVEGDNHGPRVVKWAPYSGPPRKGESDEENSDDV